MAVFLLNVCKFNECGIQFPNLIDLIHHIEATHIDYDPKVVEQKELQQPACLPLSYVLRYITDATRKPVPQPISGPGGALAALNGVSSLNGGGGGANTNGQLVGANGSLGSTTNGTGPAGGNGAVGATTTAELKRKLAIKHHSYSISSSNRSNTPTGSEMDEEEMLMSQSEDSNDSWTTEEFSSEFIMRYGSRHSGGTGPNGSNEKPFACPVPGCKKRYKNVNGIKYHSKNGHKKDGKVRKGFKCNCGKSYKTAHGLKNHSIQVHNTDNIQLTQVPVGTGSSSSAVGGSNAAANNSSTVQLSPASSISSLSSTNGVSATAVGQTSVVASSPPGGNGGANGNAMKSNYGLITIKGKNNNILATQKFVKLLTTTAAAQAAAAVQQQQQQNNSISSMSVDDNRLDLNGGGGGVRGASSNGLLQHSSSASAVVNAAPGNSSGTGGGGGGSLPSLVNLGILTPATSPRNNGQQQQMVATPNGLSGGGGGGGCGNSSSSGCSSMSSTTSNSSMESLPLTPVSPTIGKSEQFVGVAQELISAAAVGVTTVGGCGAGTLGGSVSGGAVLMTPGGDSDDHNMSDDT